jgi:hypothetical protein
MLECVMNIMIQSNVFLRKLINSWNHLTEYVLFLMMKNQTRFAFTVQIYMDQQIGRPQKVIAISTLPTPRRHRHRRRYIQQA